MTGPLPAKTRFADLLKEHPGLTTAQLINSNNLPLDDIKSGAIDVTTEPILPKRADVVVIGAGVAGLLYAIHLKRIMPEASIVVLERSTGPTYKIGESTLSPFSRFSVSDIMSVAYMLRLFHLKDGLDFVHVDEEGKSVEYQDIGGVDYSFQIERKVSELLLTLKAQRAGIKVFYGVGVNGRTSNFTADDEKTVRFNYRASSFKTASPPNKLARMPLDILPAQAADAARAATRLFSLEQSVDESSDMHTSPAEQSQTPAKRGWLGKLLRTFHGDTANTVAPSYIKAQVIADASGLTHTAVQNFGEIKKFDGMNFDAYWAYFKEDVRKEETELKDWMYCGTNHICFKDGWSWWIRLISWEKSERANLMDLITYLLENDEAGVPDSLIPPIATLSTQFNCPFEQIVSIGFTLRTESVPSLSNAPYVPSTASENEKRFWGVVHKYPVVERILRDSGRYEVIPNHYGPLLGTYQARKAMSFYRTVIAGPGWFALGNASGFTSPLFSPGINLIALPQAVLAATLTRKRLRNESSPEEVAEEYQACMADKHIPGMRDMDVLLNSMFRDPRFFMAIFPIMLGNMLGNISKNYTHGYSLAEIGWGLGCSTPLFKSFIAEVFPLIMGPPNTVIADEVADKVQEICNRYKKTIVESYSHATKYARIFRHLDDEINHDPNKEARTPGKFGGRRCTACFHANPQERAMCICCGAEMVALTMTKTVGGVGEAVFCSVTKSGLDDIVEERPLAAARAGQQPPIAGVA
ncbi:uncharacterized protein EV422DRAFT_569079 [Fimicolochytrium jonesii]|uniref:uncharacterized protein n=1 Tax=Fimicolochytrium jonesii TaxID=1396493 RepID=UPI0022FF206A|nr:uncharacterized protein EV422DRAFT_569079 [Fimicolochytrium jonesii]KAI8819201.1 hypothetical protein EV422DRAFT_569079 [Fimicolochytrium jonesii]